MFLQFVTGLVNLLLEFWGLGCEGLGLRDPLAACFARRNESFSDIFMGLAL